MKEGLLLSGSSLWKPLRLLYTLIVVLLGVTSARAQADFVAPTVEAVLAPPFPGSREGGNFGAVLALDGDHAAASGASVSATDLPGNGEVQMLRRTATGWTIRQTIRPIDDAYLPSFGADIAIRSDTMFVGAPTRSAGSVALVGAVSVYVFDGTEWRLSSEIRPPVLAASGFGNSLDYDGTRLIVGAPYRFGYRGGVFVYERAGTSWTLVATIDPPFSNSNRFGEDVAIDGSHVAATEESVTPRVNTYERVGSTWTRTGDLAAGGAAISSDNLNLSLEGDRIMVGAPMVSVSGGQGATYVFDFDGAAWNQTAMLIDDAPESPSNNHWFGTSVDLDGDRVLIGSPGAERALYFEYDGFAWTRVAVLTVADTPPYRFHAPGEAVALDGDRALVGSRMSRFEGTREAGAVFGFDRSPSGWGLTSEVNLGPQRSGHRFGTDVAVSGNRVAVCAEGVAVYPYASPSAYVFSVAGALPVMETRIQTGCTAIAIRPDQLVVGAASGNSGSSSVRVYTRGTSGWTPSQVLSSEGAFGTALSLDGDQLLVGAPGYGTAPGRAYLYEWRSNAWQLSQTFQAAIPEGSASFGTAVALDGARAVIGAPYTPAGAASYGLAFVYERDGTTWERVATLASTEPGPSGLFGAAVALSGGRALVGVPSAPGGGGVNGGRAAVYAGLDWAQEASFSGPGPESTFGSSVALDGGRAVVGARRDQSASGQAFVYRYSGGAWSQAAVLQSPRLLAGEEFGAASAIEGRRFVIGAPDPTPNAPEFGAVYVYRDGLAVDGEASPVAERPRLLSPRPNPASGTSHLVLTLAQPERVTATVFDALGRAVQTVLSGDLVAGERTLTVDASRLAPGLYVVRVAGETFAESTRLVVAR